MIEQANVFPSTFYNLNIDPDACINLISEIDSKQEKMKVISGATQKQSPNEYTTDYENPVKLDWFEKIFNQAVTQHFQKITLLEYWSVIYDSNAYHRKHNHKAKYFYQSNYSGILYLSNLGGTNFFTPNPTSLVQEFCYESKFGNLLLFPSSVVHEVYPHHNDSNKRYVVAFNVLIES